MHLLTVLQQVANPGDCALTGLCGLIAPNRSIPSGAMFAAVGLVSFGVWGLRQGRRKRETE